MLVQVGVAAEVAVEVVEVDVLLAGFLAGEPPPP
jgi:hypothetical protein